MSDYRRLLLLCVKALSTFDPQLTGVDNHLDVFLTSPGNTLSEEADQAFVGEVFSGCARYQALIKVVTDGYYAKEGKSCLRADYNLYSVIVYLVMFRLEELGMGHLKKLLNTQHTGKMHKLLQFFFNDTNLKGWIKQEWCKVYDGSFVETNIIYPMSRLDVEMREYLEQLSDKLANKGQARREGKPVTEVQPFKLTKPQPRSVPTPDRIPLLKAFKPVPKSTYNPPVERIRLARAQEENRKRAEQMLLDSDRLQFSCSTGDKSEKTKAGMEQIIAEREAKLQYNPVKPTPLPSSIKEIRPVKLNAVAILREGARVQRVEDEEEKRLASLEAGEKDASEFTRWQEEMKQREAAEKLADIQRKHLEGQLSYEEAIISKQNYTREMRERVGVVKEQTDEMMRTYFAQRAEEQLEMRQLVEATMAGHQSTREARAKLQTMKQKMVQQVTLEKQELMARALEEAEAEMRRKLELIQQIRAMESVPIIRTKFVDFTETAGLGLLSEMSVAELRERLGLMKIAEEEEAERKRKEILGTKQAKEQLLNETLENISRFKAEQNKQAAIKREQQKQSFDKHQADVNSQKLSGLQEKLEAKRKEREQLKKGSSLPSAKSNKPSTSTSRPKNQALRPTPSTTTPLSILLRTTTKGLAS
ncbi:cilia- and flagella-associated protein 99-like isoform X1 [Halichondria panicea]|uniref:cilia- and flagella-associated protein 99-like isoform X1 n=1 Tax=Halichondria panicea TaxID=6063 RepID=UPI00312B8636